MHTPTLPQEGNDQFHSPLLVLAKYVFHHGGQRRFEYGLGRVELVQDHVVDHNKGVRDAGELAGRQDHCHGDLFTSRATVNSIMSPWADTKSSTTW
ncbi:hypothetical protein BC938DRAFT_483045 [Jimgerdemannia flammicorona]|uniref:Uncharacterized protein n=1 Tax=Jimgerdemannia flammicorona TaxID=994334 RepID=A0A433QCU7_9FUNG|nr:hypothetical protein BC938DRAFT_483045 [Jimgerdemannia flammicorona]